VSHWVPVVAVVDEPWPVRLDQIGKRRSAGYPAGAGLVAWTW
jgi:hypothetical protein